MTNVINKTELANLVAEVSGFTKKDAELVVDAVFQTITDTLAKGDTVKIHNFGKFEVRHRNARKGRNPQSGEEIEIAAKDAPAFSPLKGLKDAVSGK